MSALVGWPAQPCRPDGWRGRPALRKPPDFFTRAEFRGFRESERPGHTARESQAIPQFS